MDATSTEFGPAWSASRRLGSERELRGWLDLALACSDLADAEALRHFRRDLEISTKPDRTLVTSADRGIEAMIRDRIRAAHPDHGIVGEEHGTESAGASVRWFVDPIDGTHNFVRGVPLFGTLLAVERDGEMQVGVLSAPALRERWLAWRGGGAWAMGSAGMAPGERRPIRTSRIATLADAQLLYGSPFDVIGSGAAPGFARLVGAVWRDRGFGDFWGYALVAEGAAEAMIEVDMKPWDLAAPLVLIEEAGGRLSDFAGRRSVDVGSMVASNGFLHDRILAALGGADPA